MNRVSRRTWVIAVLAFVLTAGVIAFTVRYFFSASDWVSFPGSPHLYNGATPEIGTVTDRNGTVLMTTAEGKEYSGDSTLDAAMLHILGDREGYIEAPALSEYFSSMTGFDVVNGLHGKENGEQTITLSLSAKAQTAAEKAMEGKKGTVGVYNYKTGEILCLVSVPSYDPDHVPDIASCTDGTYDGVYMNRFFRSTYTPGSVMKTATLLAALQSLPDTYSFTYTCTGSVVIDGVQITCTREHGTQTLEEAFRNSCNCAFAELTLKIGRETLTEFISGIGILDSVSVDGASSAKGQFSVEDAGDGSFAWAGVGQYTDQINPCTFMVYMGMIANGGKAASPWLVSEIVSNGKTTYSAKTEMLTSVITDEASASVRTMMRNNVVYKYGTDYFPDVEVCAKSGTAETGNSTSNAMFAGFIDDSNYPFAFIVVVEEGGSGTGTGAPIAGAVLKACISDYDKK